MPVELENRFPEVSETDDLKGIDKEDNISSASNDNIDGESCQGDDVSDDDVSDDDDDDGGGAVDEDDSWIFTPLSLSSVDELPLADDNINCKDHVNDDDEAWESILRSPSNNNIEPDNL
jgi:hypothetical protein